MKIEIYNVQQAQVVYVSETIDDARRYLELNAVYIGIAGAWSRCGEELIAVDENDHVVEIVKKEDFNDAAVKMQAAKKTRFVKRIKKIDTKHMNMTEDVNGGWQYYIDDLNSKDYDTRWSILWAITLQANQSLFRDKEIFMGELIYSLAKNIVKNEGTCNAEYVFKQIGDKLDVGFTLIERQLRGIAMYKKDLYLALQCGLNFIEFT